MRTLLPSVRSRLLRMEFLNGSSVPGHAYE